MSTDRFKIATISGLMLTGLAASALLLVMPDRGVRLLGHNEMARIRGTSVLRLLPQFGHRGDCINTLSCTQANPDPACGYTPRQTNICEPTTSTCLKGTACSNDAMVVTTCKGLFGGCGPVSGGTLQCPNAGTHYFTWGQCVNPLSQSECSCVDSRIPTGTQCHSISPEC